MRTPSAGSDRDQQRAWRSPLAWLLLLIVVTGGLTADLWLKRWSFENVASTPVVMDREAIRNDPNWRIPLHMPVTVGKPPRPGPRRHLMQYEPS